jgi:hypothetical protein
MAGPAPQPWKPYSRVRRRQTAPVTRASLCITERWFFDGWGQCPHGEDHEVATFNLADSREVAFMQRVVRELRVER